MIAEKFLYIITILIPYGYNIHALIHVKSIGTQFKKDNCEGIL